MVALTGVLAAIAVPMMKNTLNQYSLSGDARTLANAVSLARMQAAANFTQGRLYVDLSLNGYHTELWQTSSSTWITQTGTVYLSSGNESYGFGPVSSPPPNSQGAIGQSAQCLNNAGAAIGNTACVVFNSRGIPIDNTGAPTAADAVYVTDGWNVYGVTISATSVVKLYMTGSTGTPNWVQQ